jgi:putative nucleotidyltransferase with HDIG domain
MTDCVTSAADAPLAQGERIELILSQLTALPTLPAVALRLMEVTTSSESSAKDVVRILESDPALTAALLRMVRRADLGIRSEVLSVERAVVLLGFRAVRNAVLSLQLYDLFATGDCDEQRKSTRTGLWRHSLAVACAAQLIAERIEAAPAEEAFVCGLLHDIGKIAIDTCLPKSYARIVDRVERDRACICDVERGLLGFDHTVAGKRLLTHWRLPRAPLESAWLHHQSPDALPSSTRFPGHVRIVHLADSLVRRERIGFSGYPYHEPIEAQAEAVGLSPKAVENVVASLPERMNLFAEFLDLDTIGTPEVTAEALASANRELGRVNSILWENRQALKLRSVFLDALDRFTRSLTQTDRVADVCFAAADTVRKAIEVKRVLAFVLFPDSPCLQVGFAGGREEPARTSIVDWQEKDRAALAALVPARPEDGPVVAPEVCDSLWTRCFDWSPSGSLWMLPVVETDLTACGVLFDASEQDLHWLRRAGREWGALSKAFGLALVSARVRAQSERTNEELIDLNRRLREAQQGLVRARSISMIAAMAAGAAHELNSPLAVIAGRAQMLAVEAAEDEEKRALEIISEQAVRASSIVAELMAFAKPRPPEPVAQRLAEVLQTLRQHWQRGPALTERRIEVGLEEPDLTVHVDEAQLREILDGVIANAIEATPAQTGRLQINSTSRLSDDRVRLVIEDNGCGMSGDVLERAVDPFFSSRPAGRGRGLGLSRAYRLAELNGGRLWLESTPNVGTKVTIELPARPPSI